MPIENRVISACAGSGKTYTLIQRLLQLLENGAAPGEILAITFTRKAAAEIKTRLFTALEEQAAQGKPWAKKKLRQILFAADAQDDLNIHTFHGWFGVLLAGRCWTANWYGAPNITEDDSALRQQAWQRWLATTNAPEALTAVLKQTTPYSLKKLFTQDVVHHLNAWRQCNVQPLSMPDIAAAQTALTAALSQFVEVSGGSGADFTKAVEAANIYIDDDSTLAELEKAFFTAKGTVRARLEKNSRQADYETELTQVVDALNDYADLAAYERTAIFHNQLIVLAEEYLQHLQAVKDAAHQISFDDLEYHSYHAVKESGGDINAVLYRMNRRYRHILIDEFQDTSPLQWAIISCWLHAAHGSDESPSIFIVGDVKQAIYRFRHGDSRLLAKAQQVATEYYEAEHEEKNICYRLAPPLIDFVNAVFAPANDLLPNFPTHEVGENKQTLPGRIEWHDMQATVVDEPAANVMRMRNPLHKQRQENNSRQQWADAIASRVQDIVGNWTIGKGDNAHTARPEDILILLPSFTYAGMLYQALQQQGFSCAMRGSDSSFAGTLACRDIIALVRVLLSPSDNSLSLAQVLKSPLFAFSETQFARLAGGDKLWHNLQKSTATHAKEALAKLQRWHDWAQQGQLPIHDLLARIYHEGDIPARYRAAVEPAFRRQVTADLSALLDFSLVAGGGRQPLLSQFLVTLESAGSEIGAGGIRLMTIHGAKGLEAPVVILADCNIGKKHSGGGKDSINILVDWQPSDDAPRKVIFRPSQEKRAYDDIVQEAEEADEIEYNNLFYVALTRAEQALVIFSFPNNTTPRVEALRAVMQENGSQQGNCRVWGDVLDTPVPATTAVASPPAPAPAPPKIGKQKLFAPAPALYGSIVHRQVAMLLLGYDDDTIANMTTPDTLLQAKQLVQTAALQQLLNSAEQYEVEAEFIHNNALLRIDLLIITANSVWIIDYKTGGNVARYRAQMDNYKTALTPVYSDKTIHTAFVSPAGFEEYSSTAAQDK